MFERILVPLDGTEDSEAVLLPLRHVLRRKDVDVILLHAAYSVPAASANHAGFAFGAEAEFVVSPLEKTRARLEGQGLKVRTLLREGDPVEAILHTAEAEKATLIALTTHGRTGLSRWTLGSVTEEVLRRSPIPVLIDRYAAAPPDRSGLKTILVAFDGSRESLSITPTVIELARLLETEVALVKVEEVTGGGADFGFVGHRMDGPVPIEKCPDLLDRDLIEAGNPFAEAGLRTTVFRVRGQVADQINKLARVLPAEMIAMATHGRQGVARLISGSVTEQVVRSATVPLLVLNSEVHKEKSDERVSA